MVLPSFNVKVNKDAPLHSKTKKVDQGTKDTQGTKICKSQLVQAQHWYHVCLLEGNQPGAEYLIYLKVYR